MTIAPKTSALIASLTVEQARTYAAQTDKLIWIETVLLDPADIGRGAAELVEDALLALLNTAGSADRYTQIGHYYEPIAYYGGRVLKYAGIACPLNKAHMMAKPGMLMLDSYKGDRITADTHELFTQL